MHVFNKTVWGLLLIAVGVLFLLDQTGTIDVDVFSIIRVYWPVVLIYWGLKGILIHRKLEYGWGGSYIWNLILALAGGYFLLKNLGINVLDGINLWQFAVPVVLILLGLRMLAGGPSSGYAERKAALREEHRRKREEHRELRNTMRMTRREQRFQAKMARKYPGSAADHPQQPGANAGYEEQPTYDPGYSRKIEDDLDQVFHERVVKKLNDDPFPLVSQTKQSPGQPEDSPAEQGAGYGMGGAYPPPPPPPPRPNSGRGWNAGWERRSHPRRTVERSNFIGDIHLGHDNWELEPTNVSHFIGDTIIDLTKAHIPFGETRLNVSSFIGDVKVFVPNDVQVEISVTASAFIGDMKVLERHEGGLFRHMKYDTLHYTEAEKKINLTVSMFIGDVFVKRVG